MRAQTDTSNEEADDVDHDEDSHSQMKMEKLSRLKEGVHSSMLSRELRRVENQKL